ncbi:hypothetical protein PAMC26577_04765 [Caballeronia sordidicola]|uniref:Uncharacterized protein n=1 Tax=Caballeronia sordidicola TaxID=196367 RepID=A0A242N475_CABSO|nr:hypothetical protein PAMC26577_04765 [Caballeronia sordidicola]
MIYPDPLETENVTSMLTISGLAGGGMIGSLVRSEGGPFSTFGD